MCSKNCSKNSCYRDWCTKIEQLCLQYSDSYIMHYLSQFKITSPITVDLKSSHRNGVLLVPLSKCLSVNFRFLYNPDTI